MKANLKATNNLVWEVLDIYQKYHVIFFMKMEISNWMLVILEEKCLCTLEQK